MPTFKCTITDSNGNVFRKRMTSSNQIQLISDLKRDGMIPVEIIQENEKNGIKYSHQIISDFTSSICLMMESGLTLKDSLFMSRKTLSKGKTTRFVSSVSMNLDKGASFHSALSESCSNLPPLYLGLIKIGERIGSLKEVMGQLKHYMQEQKRFRDMLFSSLIYPVFVLLIVIIATILAAIFVVPGIQEILQQLGSSSSELDSMIIKIEQFRFMTLTMIPVLMVICFSTIILRRISEPFSVVLDKMIIHIPLIKTYIKDQAVYNVMYSLELLTSSGIPVNEALDETVNVVKNKEIKSALLDTKKAILKGEKLSIAFQSSIFPLRVSQWISYGESSGNVEQIFGQLKEYYQGIIEKRLKLFMTMIEPVMIIIIGIIILLFVINIVLPIITLYGSVI